MQGVKSYLSLKAWRNHETLSNSLIAAFWDATCFRTGIDLKRYLIHAHRSTMHEVNGDMGRLSLIFRLDINQHPQVGMPCDVEENKTCNKGEAYASPNF